MRRLVALAALFLLGSHGVAVGQGTSNVPAYLFYVASESDDQVTLLRFTPGSGLTIEKVVTVGCDDSQTRRCIRAERGERLVREPRQEAGCVCVCSELLCLICDG